MTATSNWVCLINLYNKWDSYWSSPSYLPGYKEADSFVKAYMSCLRQPTSLAYAELSRLAKIHQIGIGNIMNNSGKNVNIPKTMNANFNAFVQQYRTLRTKAMEQAINDLSKKLHATFYKSGIEINCGSLPPKEPDIVIQNDKKFIVIELKGSGGEFNQLSAAAMEFAAIYSNNASLTVHNKKFPVKSGAVACELVVSHSTPNVTRKYSGIKSLTNMQQCMQNKCGFFLPFSDRQCQYDIRDIDLFYKRCLGNL